MNGFQNRDTKSLAKKPNKEHSHTSNVFAKVNGLFEFVEQRPLAWFKSLMICSFPNQKNYLGSFMSTQRNQQIYSPSAL